MSLTNLCYYQKTRTITLACGIKISAVCFFISSERTRVTDRQTLWSSIVEKIEFNIPTVVSKSVCVYTQFTGSFETPRSKIMATTLDKKANSFTETLSSYTQTHYVLSRREVATWQLGSQCYDVLTTLSDFFLWTTSSQCKLIKHNHIASDQHRHVHCYSHELIFNKVLCAQQCRFYTLLCHM